MSVASAATTRADAALTRSSTFEGVVRGPGNAVVEGVCVDVYTTEGDWAGASGFTSETGFYKVEELPAGDYTIEFLDCTGEDRFAREWWNDKANVGAADVLTLDLAEHRTDVDATLAAASSIDGVVSADGGGLLGGICVTAFDEDGFSHDYGYTSVTGYYRLGGLRAADYTVEFSDCNPTPLYLTEWWNNQPTADTATTVTLSVDEDRTGVNAALAVGASFEGVVRDAGSTSLWNICVDAYDSSGDWVGEAYTSSTGYYRLGGLDGGTYRARFTDCFGHSYAYEWWNDKGAYSSADDITLTTSQRRTGIDPVLGFGGGIKGVVTRGTTPLGGVCVDVVDLNGDEVGSGAITSSTGWYHIDTLRPGSYKIHAYDDGCFDRGYGEEWYQDKADEASATPVGVSAGLDSTANVNLGDAPGAPTGATATAGSASATVTWSAPASPGSGPITSYTVTASPGGRTATTGGTSATVTGLTNGTTYTFTVKATNFIGTGPSSAASNAVTPPAAPGAPTGVTASAGDGSAAVSWTAPAANGSPITGYTVTASPGGTTATTGGTSVTVTGLANGTTYTFTVKATNAVGTGPASGASNGVRPGPNPQGNVPLGNASPLIAEPGQSLLVTGSGFAPNGTVNVVVESTPQVIGVGPTDSNGSFSITVVIPIGLSPGGHTLYATGPAPGGGTKRLEITLTVVPDLTPTGYRMATSDGAVFSFGTAGFFGSLGGVRLNQPIVGVADTPSGNGYWLVATDGGVFSFGDAKFFGSTGAIRLNQPIVGMASTPSGQGYWLVAADGGIFAFGDAQFYGSTGAVKLNQPIVGMTSTPSGKGYWLVARDGGIFAFGDAKFFGSTGAIRLNQPIVGMAAAPTGDGYWLVAADGGIFAFGSARFHGSTGAIRLNQPIIGMAATPTGDGYWLVARDGGVFGFGQAPFLGSTGGSPPSHPMVGVMS